MTTHHRNRAQADVLEALGRAGTWMTRDDLQSAVQWSAARVDDELGDLVMAAQVEFNERARSYRLAGPPLARAALRRLLTDPEQKDGFELGRVADDRRSMRIGIARRLRQPGGLPPRLVMAEVEVPYPGGQGAQALRDFLTSLEAAFFCPAMGGAPAAAAGTRP